MYIEYARAAGSSAWRSACLLFALCLACGGCARAPFHITPGPDGGTGGQDGATCSDDVDTTHDGDNCGACGHSCGGGACVASACQPVVLAAGQHTPNGLAVDATNVYWTTMDGNVMKAPIAGGPPTLLASGQLFPWGIAVDATRVYWVNATLTGQVMSVPIIGGAPTVLASMQGRPFKLAVHDGVLYWTNNGSGTIMTLPVGGGSPVQLADNQGSPAAITLDEGTLYWSSIGQGAIRSLPLVGGGTVATLASDQDAVSLFVLDTTLFWANVEIEDDHSNVFALGGNAGAPMALGTGPAPFSAVADRVHVYWTDDTSNTIMKAPVVGGASTVVASNRACPSEITIDGSNIYWIDAVTDGTIMKLAK